MKIKRIIHPYFASPVIRGGDLLACAVGAAAAAIFTLGFYLCVLFL